MLPLFSQLQDQLDKLESHELFLPDGKVGKGETELVILSDLELQKLYTLGVMFERDSKIAAVHDSMAHGEAKVNFTRKVAELDQKSEIVLSSFWASLKDKYDLWDHEGIGIREGWKVVKMDLSARDAASGLLGRLLAASIVGRM
jgi:hypothetical protein